MRVLRRRDELVITETRHGFVCANAGVDLSNVDEGYAALLPVDGDRSAHRIRNAMRAAAADRRRDLRHVRPGVAPRADRRRDRGRRDRRRRRPPRRHRRPRPGAARHRGRDRRRDRVGRGELVMGKSSGIPVAIVRGLDPEWFGDGSYRDLIRPADQDLFR